MRVERYEGPDFDEFCINEGDYLSARRDRSPCVPCPLGDLCQAGFDEQVTRAAKGLNPSLTDGIDFSEESLTSGKLLNGLRTDQVEFLLEKIPGLGKEHEIDG